MLQKTPGTLLYLSAAELDIPEFERAALIKALRRFKARDFGPGDRVDMSTYYSSCSYSSPHSSLSSSCGTVACIAGWAYHDSGKTVFIDFILGLRWTPRPRGLCELFHFRRDISLDSVIYAMETYLQTGQPDWGECTRGRPDDGR